MRVALGESPFAVVSVEIDSLEVGSLEYVKLAPIKPMKIVLASTSPRRAEVLRAGGFPFDILRGSIDETRLPGEPAHEYVLRLALEKGCAAAKTLGETGEPSIEPALVLAADTVVVIGNEILGKPTSAEDARRMIRILGGHTHEVLTGLSVIKVPGLAEISGVESTRVTFLPLSEEDISYYISTGEPFDKAGAYGIQGIGGRYVERIEGCYFNVMGLPLSRLWRALREFGWEPIGDKPIINR
jgi:septum formation protein